MIADLTCFPHRWRSGFLVCFKDTSLECIPVEKNSVAICLRSYHIFTGLLCYSSNHIYTYIIRTPMETISFLSSLCTNNYGIPIYVCPTKHKTTYDAMISENKPCTPVLDVPFIRGYPSGDHCTFIYVTCYHIWVCRIFPCLNIIYIIIINFFPTFKSV